MTRNQIENLKVGDKLQVTYDLTSHPLTAKENARWSEPRAITKIYARRENIHGKLFICFYTEFGPNSNISGSITEGETMYRLAEAANV